MGLVGCGGEKETTVDTPATTAPAPATTAPAPADDTSPTGTLSEGDIGRVLASIEKGHEVDATDPLTAQFDAVLDSLQAKFPGETRESLADATVAGRDFIIEKGKTITLLELAQGVDLAIPPEAAGTISVDEAFAASITLYLAQ